MFGKNYLVMGIWTLFLLAITASGIQAKEKNQLCPLGEVMVGLDAKGSIVCEQYMPTRTDRYVFVSSSTHTGNLGGVDGADDICTQLAIDAGIYRGANFKAWLSDSTHSPAADFVHSVVPYVNTIGETVANDFNDLIDGNLINSISYDEHGTFSGIEVWTGTDEYGNLMTDDVEIQCLNWTDGTRSQFAHFGNSLRTDFQWTEDKRKAFLCSRSKSIYCFEQ